MLPVCVPVPPAEFVEPPLAAPVEVVEPPFTAPVVEVGVDAVLVTEPAVITTGRKLTSVPDRVLAVEVGIPLSWVRMAPVAIAVHTATELPERTQLIDAVLRAGQSQAWPDTGPYFLRVIISDGISDSRWALHKSNRSGKSADITTVVAEVGSCCCDGAGGCCGGCCGGGCCTVRSAIGALNNISGCCGILIGGSSSAPACCGKSGQNILLRQRSIQQGSAGPCLVGRGRRSGSGRR